MCLVAPSAHAAPQCPAQVVAGADGEGCARLAALERRTCSAKVDCSAATPLTDEATAARDLCRAGGMLTADDLADLIDRAGGELAFHCCIATALSRRDG